jgi:hypothetical protein
MKTIEDCISEIESKAATIQSQLDLFQENIGYVGSVIGKDSTIVHSTLESRFCETMEIYRSTTRQNVEILEGYIGTLDKILQVLAEVLSVIESSKSAPVEDSLEARTSAETVLQQAADTAEKLSLDVETAIEKATGSTIQGDWWGCLCRFGIGRFGQIVSNRRCSCSGVLHRQTLNGGRRCAEEFIVVGKIPMLRN